VWPKPLRSGFHTASNSRQKNSAKVCGTLVAWRWWKSNASSKRRKQCHKHCLFALSCSVVTTRTTWFKIFPTECVYIFVWFSKSDYRICSRNLRTFLYFGRWKIGGLKMRIFFVEVLIWVLFQYNWEYSTFCQYFIVIL